MERRTFLKWATNGLGALFGLLLGIPSIAYLIDPRNRPAPAGDFKPVAKLSELKVGVPQQAIVRDIRRDGWTLYPDEVIGRVWLIRRENNEVHACSTICPHLGGSINYDAQSKRFVCPLHGATFDLSCRMLTEEELGRTNPTPRDMDRLVVQYDPKNPDIILVKYQNFYQGIEEKVPKA